VHELRRETGEHLRSALREAELQRDGVTLAVPEITQPES